MCAKTGIFRSPCYTRIAHVYKKLWQLCCAGIAFFLHILFCAHRRTKTFGRKFWRIRIFSVTLPPQTYALVGAHGNTPNVRKYISAKEEDYYMPVPTHYFIALLSMKNGSYSAIGFWVEHDQHQINVFQSANKEIAAHAVSIDRLEQLTGIDFFCNLPGAVEKAVEAAYTASVWGL